MNLPDISVVMASHNSASTIEECLASLHHQSWSSRAEVIVADCSNDGTDQLIRTGFPGVKLLHYDRPVGLPELIRDGMRHARGNIIALTDPWCVFPQDWLEKLHRAHESEFVVIGGAVENGRTNGLLSWACYFADYVAFMLPSSRRVTTLLAGNHVSYKKCVIEKALDSMEDGFWKVFFHWDLAQQGIRFLFDPELVAYYIRPDTFGSFLRRYYHHGWFFAAVRSKRLPTAARFLHLITIPVLPWLLFFQRLRAAFAKKRHIGRLLLSIPLLAVFVIAWSAGEFMGYLLGPGSRPEKVYR